MIAKEEVERKALEDQYLLQLTELRARWAEERSKAEAKMEKFFEEQKAKFEQRYNIKLLQTNSDLDDWDNQSTTRQVTNKQQLTGDLETYLPSLSLPLEATTQARLVLNVLIVIVIVISKLQR